MFRLISEQVTSGLSQEDFCKQQNISIATFGYWRKQYRNENRHSTIKESTIPRFIPLQLKTETSLPKPLEIQLPNKIILRCQCQYWQLEQLPELITELQKVVPNDTAIC